MNVLKLIGRSEALFKADIQSYDDELCDIIQAKRFLVIGGAGTIGQAVVKELFKRQPRKLHVVDINENNMVELVRDLRSSIGYIEGDFRTFPIDAGSMEYDSYFAAEGPFDYILNLSALKHVRSEKDAFTLMRMTEVNIFNTIKTADQAQRCGAKKYFAVSTDKAANPVNMMGASKRIMEMFLMRSSRNLPVSMARFANVAFSDGSLLHGFNQRMLKRQPLSAPKDVRRYFITPQESGELCLMSCLLGENRDIFFPKLNEQLHLITFSEIAIKYLEWLGYEAFFCTTENEARSCVEDLAEGKKWPCCFFDSDTTGEKDFEEFYTGDEVLDMNRFEAIGVIKNDPEFDEKQLDRFVTTISSMRAKRKWTKGKMVDLFSMMLPEFHHKETGKYLDQKM